MLWSNCLPSPMTLANNLPNNSELKCEQDHEYFLNKLLFATWTSCGLFPYCSGKWIVHDVVTRFFASVLMWISPTSPDRPIHNPRRNRHEPKHFMNEYNSAMVVESTVFVTFCWEYGSFDLSIFVVNKTSIWHHICRGLLSQFFSKTLSCLSVKTHLHCFCRGHQETQLFSRVLWVARIVVSLAVIRSVSPAFSNLSQHQLLEKLPLKHIWKLVATLERCPAL